MPVIAFTLLKYVGGPLLILALLGGAYAVVTTKAYNRGVAATVQKMQVLIDKGTERVKTDVEKLQTLPPDQLDEELRKLCEAHKKPGQTCAP